MQLIDFSVKSYSWSEKKIDNFLIYDLTSTLSL